MKSTPNLIVGALIAALASHVSAGVSADEAAQLGSKLTPIGAERAGNADGTIPEWTGGLTTPPASYKAGSGIRPDPYANEKPLYSITSKNMAQYDAKLTAVTRELLKRNPETFRVDVYPTHRTAALPKFVYDNTVKNATGSKLSGDGLSFENAYPGFPFPIPKNGNEAMHNHYMRYMGHVCQWKFDGINVDASGNVALSSTGEAFDEFPVYDPSRKGVMSDSETMTRFTIRWSAPARLAGEAIMLHDAVNPEVQKRRVWIYLPGQRRVKLAPEVGYDTPNNSTSGMTTFDDASVFSGAMDRFDMKLVGKKEVFIPYNTYKFTYGTTSKDVWTPKHVNPDFVRWELHRVWVVEATLKPGKRHIYSKRFFYLDEDSWVAMASDQYDARGQLYRGTYAFMAPAYEAPAPLARNNVTYDLLAGSYAALTGNFGAYFGIKLSNKTLPASEWSSDSLAGAGVR
jgi:hypothetical protein